LPELTKVASKEEVAIFWTQVMCGVPSIDGDPPGLKDRLKASELLSKYLGMFKESKESSRQVQFVGNDNVAD